MAKLAYLISIMAPLALAAPAPNASPEQVEPLPGKCTIGINKQDNFFWGGGGDNAGGNVVSNQAYGFIVGTNGDLTKTSLHDGPEDRQTESTGSYGGIGGGDFSVTTFLQGVDPIMDCTVTFRGQTFTQSEVDDGTCDVYSGGGPFKGTSGCRCRFDCE